MFSTKVLFSLHRAFVSPTLHPSLAALASSARTVKRYPAKNAGDPFNEVIYPVVDGLRRPFEKRFVQDKIKYSPDRLFYLATMVRGLSIDEALAQLSNSPKRGAFIIRSVLLEAQRDMVEKENVEFASNMWVQSSYARPDSVFKAMRRNRGSQISIINIRFSKYFVILREGKPPKQYYGEPTIVDRAKQVIAERRRVPIPFAK